MKLGAGIVTFGTCWVRRQTNSNSPTAIGRGRRKFASLLTGAEGIIVAGAVVELEHRARLAESLDCLDQAKGPRAAAELAVGYRFEAGLLLHPDRFADVAVLDLAIRGVAHLARDVGLARVAQLARTKQAADMLGAMGQFEFRCLSHRRSPRISSRRANAEISRAIIVPAAASLQGACGAKSATSTICRLFFHTESAHAAEPGNALVCP